MTKQQKAEIPQQSGGTVKTLERDGVPAGCRPIAGMKRGWFYHQATRAILHRQSPDDVPMTIGYVPEILAQITHLTDDGEDIRTEYLARGKRQRRPRILTEDELDRGTFAAKLGMRRPTGNDEKHAFARLIREEGDKADIVPARTYYNEAGDLVFPAADAQTIGYRVLRGSEKDAHEAWEEIGARTFGCGKSALVIGAMFAGPVLDYLDVLGHMGNCYGPGQQGKSTIATVACATMGDIKPRRQQILITWNSSKQGITQSLRQRGFMPIGLDEHSSSGRTIKESSREISQMVAGAIRAMGTADGSPRESDGFWHSFALSTSNEPLKHEGQTEDLATRLQEFQAPFFPNKLLLPDGSDAPAGHPGAEHVSKRLKRLAKNFGGWPLEWAIRKGMFRAENLAQLKKLHLELCAKHRPARGGIAATIAELHMAWVVGAHMFAEAIGVPGLGLTAEEEAANRLAAAIQVSDETNVPDHEKLWSALDALRIEAASFPDIDKLPSRAEEGFQRLRGFTDRANGDWWVVNPVVHEAGAQAGIDNVSAALRELDALQVHIRGTGKNAQRLLPKSIRYAGLGERMHCFNTRRAAELFSPDDEPEEGPGGGSGGEFPSGATPGSDPGATGVAPENEALTSSGATGATGATLSLFDFSKKEGATPGSDPEATGVEEATAPRAHDVTSVPPMPSRDPVVPFPAAVLAVSDKAFAALEAKASGWTASAVRFGVLGADQDGQGYMYLPNREPVPVALPGNVDQVPVLMGAYQLKTLWVHESAALAMGLPTYEERMPEKAGDYHGPQGPTPHPWATSGDPQVVVRAGEGLSCWMTLQTTGGRLSVALPLYEDRFGFTDDGGVAGWGGAKTPAVLLDALMVYLTATQHGPANQPRVYPYYMSPNATAKDFAGGNKRDDVVSEAIRRRAVPPVHAMPPIMNMQWNRPAEEISAAERAAMWLHQYDKNAAWLAAFGGAELGIGDPVHHTDGRAYDKKLAGYWRVASIPGTGLPGLPGFRVLEAEEGGFWLRTPGVDLMAETYPGWKPDVLEAWVWEDSKRALYGMYERIRITRERVIIAGAEGHPGAAHAKQVVGMLYQSFRGYLHRSEGPKKDHATGGAYAKDIYWRPDWAQMILDLALANTYRDLKKFAAEGRLPLSLKVDAITLTSDEHDRDAAAPASMTLGTKGGQWKGEYTAPLPELLPAIDGGAKVTVALTSYLAAKSKEA